MILVKLFDFFNFFSGQLMNKRQSVTFILTSMLICVPCFFPPAAVQGEGQLLGADLQLDIDDDFSIQGKIEDPEEGVYQSNITKQFDDYTAELRFTLNISAPHCKSSDFEAYNCSPCISGTQSCRFRIREGVECRDGGNTPGPEQTCNGDTDGDGIADIDDNCHLVSNPDQINIDGDLLGDACDNDDDNDTVDDANDNCPKTPNVFQKNNDIDSLGDICDPDDDNDHVDDRDDNCPLVANPDQKDSDGDGKGNVCDFEEVFGDTAAIEDEELVASLDGESADTFDEPTNEELLHNIADAMGNCHADNYVAPPFEDISGHWSEENIKIIHALGIVHGKKKGFFDPDTAMTRAELTKIVLNTFCFLTDGFGLTKPFPDVEVGEWFTPFIDKSKSLDIIQGYVDNLFHPHRSVSRAEAVKMILEAAEIPIEEGGDTSFSDVGKDAWYDQIVSQAASLGIVEGYSDNSFKGDQQITRAEMAKVIVKSMDLVAEKAESDVSS